MLLQRMQQSGQIFYLCVKSLQMQQLQKYVHDQHDTENDWGFSLNPVALSVSLVIYLILDNMEIQVLDISIAFIFAVNKHLSHQKEKAHCLQVAEGTVLTGRIPDFRKAYTNPTIISNCNISVMTVMGNCFDKNLPTAKIITKIKRSLFFKSSPF